LAPQNTPPLFTFFHLPGRVPWGPGNSSHMFLTQKHGRLSISNPTLYLRYFHKEVADPHVVIQIPLSRLAPLSILTPPFRNFTHVRFQNCIFPCDRSTLKKFCGLAWWVVGSYAAVESFSFSFTTEANSRKSSPTCPLGCRMVKPWSFFANGHFPCPLSASSFLSLNRARIELCWCRPKFFLPVNSPQVRSSFHCWARAPFPRGLLAYPLLPCPFFHQHPPAIPPDD